MRISDVRVVGRLFQHAVLDVVQPDLTHAGGFLGLKKIAAMADAHYVTVAPHNANSPFCTTATAHARAAMTNFKTLEVFDDFQESWLCDVFNGVPRVVDGYLPLHAGPGLAPTSMKKRPGSTPTSRGSSTCSNLAGNNGALREVSLPHLSPTPPRHNPGLRA